MIACPVVIAPSPRPRPVLVVVALLPLLAGAVAPAAAAPGTAAQSAVVGPALLSGRGELRVADPAGETLVAALPEGVELSTVASLGPDLWLAAGTRDGSTLILARGEAGDVRRVAAPEAGGAVVVSPVALAADGELAGLAWLAGPDPRRLEVRFAPWTGGGLPGDPADEAASGWGAPEVVAGAAPGSQLALAGTLLRDGSALLVWSAYDGEDDEILWSRYSGGRWSEPARLGGDNAVPDIVPAVAPLGPSSSGGAVAAWSRFDGREYTLVTARWTGDGWSTPEAAAPPGSLYPKLHAAGEGAALLYRDARRGGWTALRLDAAGRVTGRAVLDAVLAPEGDGAPAVLGASGRALILATPGEGERVTLPWQP
jgi:hypothetical protein